MRLPHAETRDTYDYANLPPPAALEQCELNYRTSPPSSDSDRVQILRVAGWYLALLAVVVPALVLLILFEFRQLAYLGIPLSLYLFATSVWNFLLAKPARLGVVGGISCLVVLAYVGLIKL